MSEIGIHRTPGFVPQTSIGGTGDQARTEGPTQKGKVANVGITPLPQAATLSGPKGALLDSAIEKSGRESNNTCPSRKEVAQRKLDQAAEKVEQAKSVGVDVAKQGFFRKMLGVAFSAVAVGIAAGVTAVTFGGAAPILALACVSMANSIGDATCAYRNVKNAQATAEGRPPPYDLPGGNSFLANVGHKAATAFGAGPETAAIVGKGLSIVVGGGLAIASVALSLGATSAPAGFELASKISSGLSGVANAYSGLAGAISSGDAKTDVRDLKLDAARLMDSAKTLHPETDGSALMKEMGHADKTLALAMKNDTAGLDGGKGALKVGGMLGKLVV